MKNSQLNISMKKKGGVISPEIYGHFSEHLGRCIYEGIYVGEESDIPNTRGIRNDVIEAFKELEIPVLRWPGGCFADEYHWMDGIGEKSLRRKMVNSNWGGVVEDNSFGTHEFMDFCELTGCQPYISINVGSGTVRAAMEWMEYMTCPKNSSFAQLREQNGHKEPWKIKYVGIGNENWGCGGCMTSEYYSDEYRRFGQFVKNYSGDRFFKVACGPNADDYEWTRTIMKKIGPANMDAISLHYYTVPGDWANKGNAVDFTDKEYYLTIKKSLYMEELIEKHLSIMDEEDPEHKVSLIVDEWGNWFDVKPGTNPGFLQQENTMRDAITAAINLNVFNHHCDRIVMANLAQVVNVLQAVLQTEGMNLIKTPTYEVFSMFKGHKGGTLLESSIDNFEEKYEDTSIPMLSQSVSLKDGRMTITLVNASLFEDANVTISLNDGNFKGVASVLELSGQISDHNCVEEPDKVKPVVFNREFGKDAQILLKAKSVVRIECDVCENTL